MMPETRRGFGLLVVAVCVFVAALAAIPALADNGTAGTPLPPPPPSGSGDTNADAGSAAGYPDASQTQAENLFTDNFSATVDSLASDPPDLSGEHPVFINNKTALISSIAPAGSTVDQIDAALARDQHDGGAAQADVDSILQQARSEDQSPELLASTLPLRTTDDSGQQAPVDLSLAPQANGYQPQNPLVDLTLPNDLGHQVAVGDQGLKLDLGATDPNGAADASADPVAGEGLFYADAAPSTDVVLAPISSGVEALYQLRAPESPNQLQIGLTLPAGANLVGAAGGAAAVIKNGSTLATIYPPNAQDAAGTPVPVSMSVAGDSLKLDVDTSAPDLRYPISVDPAIDTYTWSSNGSGTFSDWIQNKTVGSPYQLKTTCTQNVNCTSGTTGPAGLYVAVPQNASVTAQSVGSWQYRVPHYGQTTAYISHLDLGPMYFANRGDTNANPFLFAGIYDDNGTYTAYGSQTSNALNLYWSLDPGSLKTGKQGVFALWSWSNRQLSQWRDTYLGGATVTLGDRESPVLDDPTNSGISFDSNGYSNWVDDVTPTITAHATDQDPSNANAGLGIKTFQFSIPYASGGADQTKPMGCTGANASPCPQSASSGPVSYDTSQMPNGGTVMGVIATDAMSNADVRIPVVRVDHARPRISLSGGLAPGGGSGGAYTLHIDATDGDTSSMANWQSGVKQITLSVNGNPVTLTGAGPQNCTGTAGSCPLSVDYTLQPSDYTTPNLHFTVDATDELGHHALGAGGQSLDWTVPLPDTSIDSGPSGPTNDTTPSFIYSSPDSGASFQCRVDNDAFAPCDASSFTPSTALSEGSHTFEVRAKDTDGHFDTTPATRSFTVDTHAPTLTDVSHTGISIGSSDGSYSNWVDDATPSVSVTAQDDGLGVEQTTLPSTDGVVDDNIVSEHCDGTSASPCPQHPDTVTATYDASTMDDGANISGVVAQDAADNAVARTFVVRVDHTAPVIQDPSGSLTQTTGTGPYTLHVDATDGDASDTTGVDWQSGVRSIEVDVNGQQVANSGQHDCGSQQASCPLSLDYTLNPGDFSTNELHFKVIATDELGHSSTREWDTTITGADTQPVINLSGSLFSATDGWVNQLQSYQLVATAQDISGATQLQLKIDGQQVDSVSQSCAAGGCSLSHTFIVSPADYEGGSHSISLVATDQAGNTSHENWIMNVDPKNSTQPVAEASDTFEAADATATELTVTPPPQDAESLDAEGDTAVDDSGSELQATGTQTAVSMARQYSAGFNVVAPAEADVNDTDDDSGPQSQPSPITVAPTQVAGTASTAAVANGVAAVYSNTDNQVDTAVRPIFDGVSVWKSIRSSSSPQSFSWQVSPGAGLGPLRSVGSQNAEVDYTDGSTAVAISASPARDATGAVVPTTLTTNGNTATLTVSHQGGGFVYPIVTGTTWETGFVVAPPGHMVPGTNYGISEAIFVGAPEVDDETLLQVPQFQKAKRKKFHRTYCRWEENYFPCVEKQLKYKPPGSTETIAEKYLAYETKTSGYFHYRYHREVWWAGTPTNGVTCKSIRTMDEWKLNLHGCKFAPPNHVGRGHIVARGRWKAVHFDKTICETDYTDLYTSGNVHRREYPTDGQYFGSPHNCDWTGH
jgi:hypothetical protein